MRLMSVPSLAETDDFIDETLTWPLRVVFRDEYYVAVFKPAGLIVHRSESTLPHEPILLQTLRDQLKQQVFPVHRLDRPTAGLILFALNREAAARMVDLFTNRLVSKYYQAMVRGLTPETGIIDEPLGLKSDDDWVPSELADQSKQTALTQFSTLARFQLPKLSSNGDPIDLSLLEIAPMTGRSHQIRRHLRHIGHPIIGDHRHGERTFSDQIATSTGVVRMLLTSMRLDFRHPYSQELQSILVQRGTEFDRVITALETFRA